MPLRPPSPALLLLLVAACSAGGGSSPSIPETQAAPLPPVAPPIAVKETGYALGVALQLPATKPEESEGLHNVFHLGPHIVSGSEPHGEEAFEQLAAMGIKTILSVDGKVPDAALAAKHGMRYVHVPIEYKGLTDDELLRIAKTFRELPGPVYTHCFHGKHRGPAAAAVGRLVLDGVPREQALAEMRQWCGTAAEYDGLYRDIAAKAMPSEAETRAYAFNFPAAHVADGFRAVMIDLSRRHDNLKKLEKKDWAVDPKHPDVDPVNEAVQVAQILAASCASSEVAARADDFRAWMKASVEQSERFVGDLKGLRAGDEGALAASKKSWGELNQTCTACHDVYRNK